MVMNFKRKQESQSNKKLNVKDLIYWFISFIFLMFFIAAISSKGMIAAAIAIVACIYSCPLVQKNLPNYFLSMFMRIYMPVVLLLALIVSFPTNVETTNDSNDEFNAESETVELTDFQELEGTKSYEIKNLKFEASSSVEEIENSNELKLFPCEGEEIPYMVVSVYEEDVDFSSSINEPEESKIQNILKESSPENSIIENIDLSIEEKDSVQCIKTTYDVIPDDKNIEKLNADSLLIPTKRGMYAVTMYTFASDKNDYKFDDVLETFETNELVSTIQGNIDKDNQLKQLKKEIEKISCLENANEDEKALFNSRKEKALKLIKEEASVEEVQNAKSELEKTNQDIQSRIDQEAAEKARIEEENRQRALEEERARQQQETQQRQQQQQQQQYNVDYYLCEDGTKVPGTSDPHAKGRANACYGHGGFVINH